MASSTYFSNKDISRITTYQSGVAQASAHRVMNRIVSDYLMQHGLTAMQWFMIGHIYDAGSEGTRLSDLMRRVHTTLPYITNTIALLESKQIVKKVSHTGDSRIKLVSITDSFAPNVELIESGLREYMRKTLYHEDGITRQELQDYITVLYKIIHNPKL